MLTQTGIVSSTKARIIPPSEYQAWWWNYLYAQWEKQAANKAKAGQS